MFGSTIKICKLAFIVYYYPTISDQSLIIGPPKKFFYVGETATMQCESNTSFFYYPLIDNAESSLKTKFYINENALKIQNFSALDQMKVLCTSKDRIAFGYIMVKSESHFNL